MVFMKLLARSARFQIFKKITKLSFEKSLFKVLVIIKIQQTKYQILQISHLSKKGLSHTFGKSMINSFIATPLLSEKPCRNGFIMNFPKV